MSLTDTVVLIVDMLGTKVDMPTGIVGVGVVVVDTLGSEEVRTEVRGGTMGRTGG